LRVTSRGLGDVYKRQHSVREFCEIAFSHVGLDWQKHVVVDPDFYRPAEIHQLIGDSTRARQELGWTPTTTFPDLVRSMVDHDMQVS
jgi:GDPmannose 4,6-dehydratase